MSAYVSSAVTIPQRQINVVITLGKGTFGDTGSSTFTVVGCRASAAISKKGLDTQGALDLRIYGMTDSQMNQVSQIWGLTPNAVSGNDTVTVLAGDAMSGMSKVFSGTIRDAQIDYTDTPGVSLHIFGLGAGLAALKPVPPTSYSGGADVVDIMASLAATMGMAFENDGVSGVVLHNPYFPGTALDQYDRCKDALRAQITTAIDDGVLAIWPAGSSRRKGSVPLISAQTGMVGYPTRSQVGVDFVCIYNPGIVLGGNVQVQSSNPVVCGTWHVLSLDHTLESETPGDQWFTAITTATPGIV